MRWKPNLAPGAPQYQAQRPDAKERRKKAKEGKFRAVSETAWGALGEVVGIAEGRHRISLGKMTLREKKA